VISLSFGDDAKVGRGRSASRLLYAYLRIYSFVNVSKRINTVDVVGCQAFVFLGAWAIIFNLFSNFHDFLHP
jgi:hypothetical protein